MLMDAGKDIKIFTNFWSFDQNFYLPSTVSPLCGQSRWKLKFFSLDILNSVKIYDYLYNRDNLETAQGHFAYIKSQL